MFDFNPLAPHKSPRRGKPLDRESITPAQARAIASKLTQERTLTPRAGHLISALTIAGVLNAKQIQELTGFAPRSLARYVYNHILDRVDAPSLLGQPPVATYTLGLVGLEVAKLNASNVLIPTGYTSETGAQRIEHDLLVSEIALRLSRFFGELGYTPLWRSKYQATIHDENNAPALEPDAMLSLTRGDGKYIHFFIEYHNEDFGTRAANKIERYERVRSDGRWKRELEIDAFPVVLVVFRHKAVIDGYKGALTDVNGNPRADVRCTYLGTSLAAIQDHKLGRWGDIRLSKPTYLVPEAETRG